MTKIKELREHHIEKLEVELGVADKKQCEAVWRILIDDYARGTDIKEFRDLYKKCLSSQ